MSSTESLENQTSPHLEDESATIPLSTSPPPPVPSVYRSWAPPILSYCGSSILMTLTNKLLLSGFKHDMIFLLLTAQSLICVILLQVFKHCRLIQFRGFDLKTAKTWFPVSFLLGFMLFTGGKSLQYMSIPVFTIFKNLAVIVVAYGEKWTFGNAVTRWMLLSFFLMFLSSVVAAWNDLEFDIRGYIWMTINCFSSAAYVISMRLVIKQVSFKEFDTVFYNNLLPTPIFLLFSMYRENWNGLFQYYISDSVNRQEASSLAWSLVLSGFAAFAISYSTAWCIRVTNSTTYSMVGALNKLPIAIAGILFFGNQVSAGGILSILLGFGSGLLYSYSKSIQPKDIEKPVLPITKDEEKE